MEWGVVGSLGRQSIWRRRPSADHVCTKSGGFRLPCRVVSFLYPKIRFRRRHRDRVLADCRCPHRARLRPGSIGRHPERLQWTSRPFDVASPRGRPLAGYDHPALAHELHNPDHLLRASRMGSYSLLPRISDFVSSRVVQAVSPDRPAGRPSAASTVINQCVQMQTDPLHLLVDSQLSRVSQRSYNCFHYVRTFIERSPPSSIFTMWWDIPNSSEIEGPSWPQNFQYLEGKGYQELATSQSLQNFQAQVGISSPSKALPMSRKAFPICTARLSWRRRPVGRLSVCGRRPTCRTAFGIWTRSHS